MTIQIAVIHEAPADFVTATELADRVLLEPESWLRDQNLDDCRIWHHETSAGRALTWSGIKKLSTDAKIRGHGHFRPRGGGSPEPGENDARSARKAILFVFKEYPKIDAIVLIRDQDKYPDRRAGYEQARNEKHSVPIVVGIAVLMREAWILSGFSPDPADEAEDARLRAVRRRLGLDPRTRSHDISDPKRALTELTADDRARERRCWLDPSLATLRERGQDNGLAEFLDDVTARLAPLFGHAA